MKEGYAKRDFDKGPETYRSQPLLDTIYNATGLKDFQGTAVVMDLMSGPGGVAFGLQERAPQHEYAVLDASQGQLDKIDKPIGKILGDVRDLASVVGKESVDVAAVRYGIKDIPQDQQPQVLLGILQILKPGGVLVITDMVSPEGTKEWNNKQHSLKQQLSGRSIEKEGECHIPTEAEWVMMLGKAGFDPNVFGYYTSHVTTTDWVKGKQITEDQLPPMHEVILGASDGIKREFNIREENGEVKLDYPVVIIRAVKSRETTSLPSSGDVYVAN